MYKCVVCNKESADPTGWARAQINHTHYLSGNPVTVTPDEAFLVYDFDTDKCRDIWIHKADPGPPTA